jgi:hypothetical protein
VFIHLLGFKALKVGDTNFLNDYPVLAIILVFLIGMLFQRIRFDFLIERLFPLRKLHAWFRSSVLLEHRSSCRRQRICSSVLNCEM